MPATIKNEDKIILLLSPKFLDTNIEYPDIPLNTLCLGSFLKEKGYNVVIIDQANWTNEIFFSKIRNYLKNSICVGISAMTAQVPYGLRISKFIKKINPNMPVIWGGKHPTIFPEQTVRNSYIDVAVRSEGEQTLLEIVKAIENNNSFGNIKGITFLEGNELISTQKREFLDMNKLPFLKYKLLEITKKLSMQKIQKLKRWGPPLQTSRGCPYRCAFCINKILKEGIRFRKPDLVLDDIEKLKNMGINKIRIIDECFFISKKRSEDIVYGIIDNEFKIKWTATARANFFNDYFLNREFLKNIKVAGCVDLGIGAESGSQRVLDKLKKDIKVEDTIRSARMLSKAKIHANYSFMIGVPGETKEDIKKTLKLIYKITKIHPDNQIYGPQIFRPFPGSDLFDEISRYVEFPKRLEDWEKNGLLFGNVSRVPINFQWLNISEYDLKKLRFYGSNANGFAQPMQFRRFYYKVIEYFLKRFIRTRIKYSFYGLPLEYTLYQQWYNFKNYLNYKEFKGFAFGKL